MSLNLAESRLKAQEPGLFDKIANIPWGLVGLIMLLAGIGYALLYSAAGGEHGPWAWRHALRFAISLGVMLTIALIDIRFWFRCAFLIYGAALGLLVLVEVIGIIGKGAQRWIDLGFMQLQPSEIMKIALVLALARLFHGMFWEDVGRIKNLILPTVLVLIPAALVLRQPDLGTAVMLLAGGGALFFLAGVRLWKFILLALGGAATLPIAWSTLHAYQKQRVLTFLDPAQDPLGSGYHIIQSKIALGSGGVWGRGFLNGSQAQLSFLPEKQTDFVFTMLGEEFGLVGALFTIGLFAIVTGYGVVIAMRARAQFARLVAMGVSMTFFFYVVINIAMITGLIPVVGVPLPLISYGGTAMLTAMIGFGLLGSVAVHSQVFIARFPAEMSR